MIAKFVVRTQKGSNKAFRKLYDQFYESSMRMAYRYLQDENDAADAVQETFIRVHQYIDGFDTSKPFEPWFYRILKNEIYRIIDKRPKHHTVEDEALRHVGTPSFEKEMNEKEHMAYCLNQLSPAHHDIIVLKYIDELSEAEVAECLDISLSAAKSRLFQARKALATILRRDLDE